jgi:hypothetical protein
LKDQVKQWQTQVRFWQNRHDNFLKQMKVISADMERLKSENEALIFINKELGRVIDGLKAERDDVVSIDDEEDDVIVSQPKTKKAKTVASRPRDQEDDDAARVCTFHLTYRVISKIFSEFLLFVNE